MYHYTTIDLKSNETFVEYSFGYTRALIPLIQTKKWKE